MKRSVALWRISLVFLLGLFAATAHAENHKEWKKSHPRRAQVNRRLNNQNRRINQGVKSGKLTQEQAGQLKAEDKQIRTEERAMAAENGGHITKAEHKALNQQENAVSKQIYKEKHPAQAAGK